MSDQEDMAPYFVALRSATLGAICAAQAFPNVPPDEILAQWTPQARNAAEAIDWLGVACEAGSARPRELAADLRRVMMSILTGEPTP